MVRAGAACALCCTSLCEPRDCGLLLPVNSTLRRRGTVASSASVSPCAATLSSFGHALSGSVATTSSYGSDAIVATTASGDTPTPRNDGDDAAVGDSAEAPAEKPAPGCTVAADVGGWMELSHAASSSIFRRWCGIGNDSSCATSTYQGCA
jgi:hypothetical protein